MKPVCISSARFNLKADVLRPGVNEENTNISEFQRKIFQTTPVHQRTRPATPQSRASYAVLLRVG
jgi:hypothetical protein